MVADVEFAIGNNRMCPGRLPGPVWLFESAALEVITLVRIDQKHIAILGAVIDPSIGVDDGSFLGPTFVSVTFVPEDFARRKVQASKLSTTVPTVRPIEITIDDNHATVVVLHVSGKPDLLGLDVALLILH